MRSMTGYGRSDKQNDSYSVSVELRSVNSRYFECHQKALPKAFGDLEFKLSSLLKEALVRGKVSLTVSIEPKGQMDEKMIDYALIMSYHEALSQFSKKENLSYSGQLETLLTLPNVLNRVTSLELARDEDLEKLLLTTFQEALSMLLDEEAREGQTIFLDMVEKLASVRAYLDTLSANSAKLLTDYEARLRQRIEAFIEDNYAEDRILAEIAILAEKSTIDEELTRLSSHLSAFEMMSEEAVVGRKLDFMLQEMNREINTIGSKIQTIDLSQIVVEIKGILENIREQVQNIV